MGKTAAGQESGSNPKDSKTEGETAFGRLAGYIFGKNSRKEKMSMTAPVFSHPNGRLQFVMDSSHQVRALKQIPSCRSKMQSASERLFEINALLMGMFLKYIPAADMSRPVLCEPVLERMM